MFLCDVRSFSSRHLNCMLSSSGAQFLAVITVVIKFLFCFSCSHSFYFFSYQGIGRTMFCVQNRI